ncbi:hypothetical protein [Magnetovibrio sp.]|uniref:hypothetical protein n=1 Tax=Magnetovibrio sp. TaxID=2024836 RepID=UPI002F95CA0E
MMAKDWTPERLKALTPRERARLYENAEKAGSPAAGALMQMILDLGLALDDGTCVGMDDPLVVEMHRIVFSDEAHAAAAKAVAQGIAPMAVIDPMIAGKLRDRYGKHNMTTHTAGGFVADLMREMGYHDTGRRVTLPDGCVARSAKLWDRKIG